VSSGFARRQRGGRLRPASRGAGGPVILAVAALVLVASALVFFPSLAALLGLGPHEVLVLYVREENSLGLSGLPHTGAGGDSLLDPVAGRLVLPPESGPVPRGTAAVILRETFAAGVRVDARTVFVRRFPVTVEARAPGGSEALAVPVAPGCALLAVDLVLDRAGREAVRVQAPELAAVLAGGPAEAGPVAPGGEWRAGAATAEDGTVVVLGPGDPSYEPALREAFYAGRPVSVITLANLGFWDTDAIETPGG